MFLMQDPQEEKKQRQEEYMIMEKIIKQEQMQQKASQAIKDQDDDDDDQKQIKDLGGQKKQLKSTRKSKQKSKQKKKPKPKQQKKSLSIKITKKDEIQKAIKNFIPAGITLFNQKRPTEDEYRQMLSVSDAPQFTLNYKIFLGKILKIVDGDTVRVAIKLSGVLTRFTFRLNGVDTPESRTGQVKEFGQYVKELLRRMLEGKIVKLEAGQFDKYGRVLSRVYAFTGEQEFCVNDFLIENQMAKPYEGKTKDQFGVKDYEKFKTKYLRTSWPQIGHYPIAMFKQTQKP